MSVRAKFKAVEKTITSDGASVKLTPVIGGSTENDAFFKWTPWGSIEIGTINRVAAEQFEVDAEYYVDFTKILPLREEYDN